MHRFYALPEMEGFFFARKQISAPFVITFGGNGLRLLRSSLPAARLTAIRLRCLPICCLPAAGMRKYGRLAALLPAAIRAACAAIGAPIRRAFRFARCADAKISMLFPSAQIFRFLLQLIEQVQGLNGRHGIEA